MAIGDRSNPIRVLGFTMIRMARRACIERKCGVKYAMSGTRGRGSRCADCPLDDVDAVEDALAATSMGGERV